MNAVLPGLSVLLIDDERDLVSELGDYLKAHGLKVAAACSGPDGLRLLETIKPDIVVCDVSMPGMDGQEVLKAIRGREDDLANVPFMFITAHATLDDELKARGIGADDFVGKPDDLARILAKIRARVAQAGRLKAEADKVLRSVKQRMSDAADRREQNLLSAIVQLAGTIKQLGGHIASIQAVIDPQRDPDLTEATSRAVASAERAAKIAKTASIIASLAPASLERQPKTIDPAEIMTRAAERVKDAIKDEVTFSVTPSSNINADPDRLGAFITHILLWVSVKFPGSLVTAAAVQAEAGHLHYDVDIASPYHDAHEIKGAWDKLQDLAVIPGTFPHWDNENFDPADACALEIIELVRASGGVLTTSQQGQSARIHLEIW